VSARVHAAQSRIHRDLSRHGSNASQLQVNRLELRILSVNENHMAHSLTQIQKKIQELQRKAEALREKEVVGVVDRIKIAIRHYGLTATDLGFSATPSTARDTKAVRSKSAGPAYEDGNGNTWAGRGPRPHWLRNALAAGRALEEFAIAGVRATSKKGRVKRTNVVRAKYRDEAGHSWSGMGPRPRWLKEAIEIGRSLEDFKG
jgi:DNA-binding protein H-NS